MTQLHILQNNFTNNGFTKRYPVPKGNTPVYNHPDGPDWRGFMFYHDGLDGKEHLMVAVSDTTDFDWRCKDVSDDTYVRWVHRDILAQAYVSMLHEWIEENGGIS